MQNQTSINAVESSYFLSDFLKPRHQDYCFWRIPASCRYLLTGNRQAEGLPNDVYGTFSQQYKNIVVILIDAFGWCFYEHYSQDKRFPFLSQLNRKGLASKLTSQFPSTTACHITSIHTGKNIGSTGVCEWFYYDSDVDLVISPLTYTTPEGQRLLERNINPSQLFPANDFYTSLLQNNIQVNVFQPASFAGPYNDHILSEIQTITYEDESEGLAELTRRVNDENTSSYSFFYFDSFDCNVHRHGPYSAEAEQALSDILGKIETKLWSNIAGRQDTALVLTADHGATHMNPKNTFYVNKEMPELLPFLKRTKQGKIIAPCGSARDLFLHLEQSSDAEKIISLLRPRLEGVAEVFHVPDLVHEGFFSDTAVSSKFKRNIGDILIAPFAGESVFWLGENHKFQQTFLGHHGGLTKEEMETLFWLIPTS